MRYWDTSTLAKLYFSEPDSSFFEAHLAARKEAEGFIGAGKAEIIFARFLADVSAGKVTLVPFDEMVESHYRNLVLRLHRLKPPVVARTLDCIHVATAELINAEAVVVTDAGFRKAADVLGLKIFP